MKSLRPCFVVGTTLTAILVTHTGAQAADLVRDGREGDGFTAATDDIAITIGRPA